MSGPTQPTEQYFDKGVWGYDGSQWRKLALLFGYTDRYAAQASNLAASAGTNVLSLTAVPAGEVWRVASIAAFDATSAITAISISAGLGAVNHYLATVAAPAVSELLIWTGEATLKAGDFISCAYYGCIAGDDIYLSACGYKMAVG